MKYLLSLLLLVLATVQPINAKDADPVKYDIMSAGSGVQGTYLVKVYVYAKSGKVSDQQLMYAAVHGVLFRGFQGKPSAPALAGQPVVEEQKQTISLPSLPRREVPIKAMPQLFQGRMNASRQVKATRWEPSYR